MTATKQPKRNQSGDDMREQLKTKIEEVRASIQRAIISGDNTMTLREYLRELEAEQQKLNEAAAAQIATKEAAQRDAQAAEAQRINEAAETLQEARDNRLAALSARFVIPARPVFDSRNSFNA
jgi:vacuolar-type H+-ATPase subunit I/STV1